MDGLGLYVRLSLVINKTIRLGLYVRSSLLIDKTMLGQAPLHYFSESKDCRVAMPENWVVKLNSHTGRVICGVVTPKDLVWNDKTPMQNHENIWYILGKNLNFVVRKDVWCYIVDIIFFNIKNWLVIARAPSREV